MRLIRFRKDGVEKPGIILDDERKLDVSSFGYDFDESFFEMGGLGKLEKMDRK